jgi:hypothetical protein
MEKLEQKLLDEMELLEKYLEKYHRLADKFTDVWMPLSLGKKVQSMIKYRRYGIFIFDYNFHPEERTNSMLLDGELRTWPRKRLEGANTPETRIAAMAMILQRLIDEYPEDICNPFQVPRHQKVAQEKKEELAQAKLEIFDVTDQIVACLRRVKPIADLFRKEK